jgi:4-amino-4-deoxy-L-arabinose transferase-like glycosyltransferase
MNKYTQYVYKFFLVTVILTMMWAVFTTIFSPRIGEIYSLFRNTHSYRTVIAINILCLLFTVGLYVFISRSLKQKQQRWKISNKIAYGILSVELIIYFVSLLLFLKFIGFNQPVDDTAFTLKYLQQLSQGESWGFNYMYSNPQNLLLMYIFSVIQFFFGTNYYAIIIVFSLMHVCTIALSFFSMKQLKVGNLPALIAIQVLIFAFQVTLHVPVAYTDILSLFFIALTLFFLTKYLEGTGSHKQSVIFLTMIFCAIGYISKGTVLVLIIALALFLLLKSTGRQRTIAVLPFVVLLCVSFFWNQFIHSQQLFPDTNYGQPNTHYIMMGLNGTPIPDDLSKKDTYRWSVGTYSSADQKFTWDMFLTKRLPKDKIQQEHIKVIKERLSNMNLRQLIKALNTKAAVTWSSGDLKSSFEIFLSTGRKKDKMWVFENNISGLILYAIMMVIQYIIYFGIIFAAIRYFKEINLFIFFNSIYITGYFAFLLLWEASPRYAMGIFIPAVLAIGLFLKKENDDHQLETRNLY